MESSDLCEWLQEQAAVLAGVLYEHRWGPNYERGQHLPLDWFTSDQQRHLVAHRMCNLPTMTVLAECSEHRRYSHTYTQPSRLPAPVGRHPGHCLLVPAPSAHHTTLV